MISDVQTHLFCAPGLEVKGQEVEQQLLSTSPPTPLSRDGESHSLPTIPFNGGQPDSAATTQPAQEFSPETRMDFKNRPTFNLNVLKPKSDHWCLSGCGGVLTDSEGTFSSPNHPGSYPPNSLCVWVIRVPPPNLVQIHVSSLTVEGPSPCLFDWLEVQEQVEQSSVVTRSVTPPLSFQSVFSQYILNFYRL